MKARVKATGEIIEISTFQDNAKFPTTYDENELEFLPNDYWTRLEHQAAIAAMQGILSNYKLYSSVIQMGQVVSEIARGYANELVEKMKEEKK